LVIDPWIALGRPAGAVARHTGHRADPPRPKTRQPRADTATQDTPALEPTDATQEPPTPGATPDRSSVDRFGVIESFEDAAAADRLGIGWTRARFQWAEVQPDGPRQWQSPLDDETLAAELAAGREVVGLLIGIPDWARDRQGVPRGLALPADDPGNTWAVFVTQAVERYAGRIDRWIIWNEPDIDDPEAPGHTWDGDIEQFAQLQRVAYLAAKAANPDAVVHLGAFTYFWDPGYFARFLDVLAADPAAAANNTYFDVATAHLYFTQRRLVLYAQQVLADGRINRSGWKINTADERPLLGSAQLDVVSLNQQAAFIPRAGCGPQRSGAHRRL
jgi:hypothetical protein